MITNVPPGYLDGCRVLAYALVDDSIAFSNRRYLNVDGKWLGKVPALAVCEWDVEPELVVMHCDEDWNVLGLEGWNAPGVPQPATVQEVIAKVDLNYQGLEPRWVHVGQFGGRG